jgi:apolipoprotein D and lipocalin family protein
MLIWAGVLLLSAVSAVAQTKPLRVVPNLDLARYAGKWYEVARFPNRFQEKCADSVTATYTLQRDGNITVLNQCRERSGKLTEASGVARLAKNGGPNSILKVRFAPRFLSFLPQVWGDYQVIALGEDYSYSVVGDPERKYLWILSRTPRLEDAVYTRLVKEAQAQGFDTSRLVKTVQK